MTRRQMLALTGATVNAQQGHGNAPPICFMTAVELARRLRKKDLSAREVLDAHLRQIERVNPKVNAIVTLVADQAMVQAKAADEAAAKGRFLGPLHGLPVAHKDLQETKGIRTTFGSTIYRDYVPDFDTLLIERIRRSGAITIGKTNVPEFGAAGNTFNSVFGATRNRYDLSRTSGGSSGGAAAALACGLVPLADGSDTGGSLRIPASFCAVVGFRTSPGRVPRHPTGSAWNPLSVLGPMARTVPDAGLLMSVIAGPDSRSPLSIHEPGSRFGQPLRREFKGVRIAWCSQFGGLPFDRPVRAVFEKQRGTFQSMGCLMEEKEPDFSGADEIFRVFRGLYFYLQHRDRLAKHRHQMKATLLEDVDRGARLTGSDVAGAEAQRSRLFARLGEFMQRYEFFVLPTLQVLPFDVNQPYVKDIDGIRQESYIDWLRSCYYVTVIGHPAISVPSGFTPDGLPVGIQIVGRHHDDWGVLQIAHAFEQARGAIGPLPATAVG